MRIGVPTEIKVRENRVALVPDGARDLVDDGHEVLVQAGAGAGVGLADEVYREAGARILPDASAVFDAAELLVKVKEPQPEEGRALRADQTLFTFLHLAAEPAQADMLMASGVTAIAYETVRGADGSLPLLTPMSEVAGRMSVQVGAHCLEQHAGGAGVLLGGVPGVAPGHVVVLGGGVAGTNAVEMAIGIGARVSVVDISPVRLRELAVRFGSRITTAMSTSSRIAELLADADLVVGAVLVPGDAAPKLVTREMLRAMRPGSVIVDISIDQGGCFETSRPTTHAEPTFVVDGIVHYCVTNMPGAVARTSTFALCNATLPYVRRLAAGIDDALGADPGLAEGVNVRAGKVVQPVVAEGIERTRRLQPAA